MYQPLDQVLKKSVSDGVVAGIIISAAMRGEEQRLKVKWYGQWYLNGCAATAVLPNTPENRAALQKRYEKLQERRAKR